MKPEDKPKEPKMDPKDLYREEIFTDRKVGTIRRLTPVKTDGSTDGNRSVLYVGQAQILTTVGAVPLSFEIDARSLEEAVAKFSDIAKQAVEHAVKELQDLRREAASSIVLPGSAGSGFVGPGGISGGGTIQHP